MAKNGSDQHDRAQVLRGAACRLENLEGLGLSAQRRLENHEALEEGLQTVACQEESVLGPLASVRTL
jgi:hypothetical protein